MTSHLKARLGLIVYALAAQRPRVAEEVFLAYRRSDYATTALRHYRPLAKKGLQFAQFNLGLLYDWPRRCAEPCEAMKGYRLVRNKTRRKPEYSWPSVVHRRTIKQSGAVVSLRGTKGARLSIPVGRNVRPKVKAFAGFCPWR